MSNFTKKEITQTFINLCEKKSYEKITVKEIVEEAGISKQTFYNHFIDKYDLMEYTYARHTKEMAKLVTQTNKGKFSEYNIIVQTLNYFYKYKKYFASLLRQTSANEFLTSMYISNRAWFSECVKHKKHVNTLNYHENQIIDFYAAGAITLTRKWILNDMTEPVEEFAEELFELLNYMLDALNLPVVVCCA
ncbi:MAG: TetR/AcrR family transcriptional regulator C-terminal domain-containing protein [Lachnospiraceae bacterium]|nr:TetR/AcrR family transcriptional regulator C-terminal domain-containing protein [Lachnospiraceae bacterium]